MTVKEFVTTFDITKPDWTSLPEGFPNCDLGDLSSEEIGKFNAVKALWDLAHPKKPEQSSRVWTDPEGYRFLVQWSNAVLLRFLIHLLTDGLPKSEYRRKAQVDDAARSVVRNIEEGYKRATTKEYIDFIGYSQGSLEEVKGDVREMTEDGFLKSVRGSSLAGIGINLGEFHKAVQGDKGNYRRVEEVKGGESGDQNVSRQRTSPFQKDFSYRPLTVLYPPLSEVRAEDLTYEIFLELINKTDRLLRGLVESLEKKLGDDQKVYQISQAKIQAKYCNS